MEILVSLFVLSGALAVIFSGFDVSSKINMQAKFESEASFLAERELELAKSELLNGNLKADKAKRLKNRFRLKPGWQLYTLVTTPDKDDAVRLQVRVSQADRVLQLESYLFLPGSEVKNEG